MSKERKLKDGSYVIWGDKTIKNMTSNGFNYRYNMESGLHMQWGENYDHDPQRCNFGPIIADIEVTSKCGGPGGRVCSFCYKSNTAHKGMHMTLQDFKTVFDKLPPTLTQIAFGADADLSLSPNIYDMMDYARSKRVVPNITVADVNKETAEKLAKRVGAVAVSWYGMENDKNFCYNSIQNLHDAGVDQINIHFMLSKESLPYVDELIEDIETDSRLKHLNAVVFLSLKQKGRGVSFVGCNESEFRSVVEKMLARNIGFGFDSCSAPKFLKSVEGHEREEDFKMMSESCESLSSSIYINEKGVIYPCSFMENMSWNSIDYNKSEGWNMLDDSIKDHKEFVDKVWNSDRAIAFSTQGAMCASCGNGCQVYTI